MAKSRRQKKKLKPLTLKLRTTRVRKKISQGSEEILDSLRKGYVTYVVNTITEGTAGQADGHVIRRCAIDNNVPVFTSLDTVRVLLDVLEENTMGVSTI